MKNVLCLPLLVVLCTAAAGCDLAKAKQLAARVERLEGENQRLAAENKRLAAENGRFQSELDAARKQIDQMKEQIDQMKKTQAKLGAAATGKLRELIKQYGEALNVAKDLGLPELKDMSVDDLLKGLPADEGQSEGGASPKK